MAQITSGLVSIEDGLKKAEEYAPPRKVRVELSFSVAEGESFDAVFDLVSNAATNRVHSLLHGTAIAVVNGGVGVSPAPAAAGEAQAEPKTRVRRTKAQIEADNAAAAKAAGSTGGDAGGAQTSDDPFADGGEASAGSEQTSAGASSGSEFDVPAAEEAGGEDWDVPPAEEAVTISDADLNSEVQKKNAELNNPKQIRDLIGTYNPDPTQPFQLRQIPAAKRAEFLAKLKALKAAA